MSEYAIFESYETPLAAFEDLDRLREGVGGLVAEYLDAETIRMAQDSAIRQQILDEASTSVSLLRHFEGLDNTTVSDIAAKRSDLSATIGSAAKFIGRFEISGPKAARVLEAASAAGVIAAKVTVERPEQDSDIEQTIMRYINTSGIGDIVSLADLQRLFVPRHAEYARTISGVLASLSAGRAGRVLNRTGNRYMILNKPGHPAAAAMEVEPLLPMPGTYSLLAKFSDSRDVLGLDDRDVELTEEAIVAAEDAFFEQGIDREVLFDQSVAALQEIFARPWLVARALEILPGKDPRHYLLTQLLDHSHRERFFSLQNESAYRPGATVRPRKRVDPADYRRINLDDDPPKPSKGRRRS